MDALLEAVVADLVGHFNVLNETLPLIGSESRGINVNLEAEAIDYIYLSWWQFIEFNHSFNFNKLYIVAILELVALVLMHSDNAGIGLSCIFNVERFGFLAIIIINIEIDAIVQEGETMRTVGLGKDEADLVLATEFISFNGIVNICQYLCVSNDVIIF